MIQFNTTLYLYTNLPTGCLPRHSPKQFPKDEHTRGTKSAELTSAGVAGTTKTKI
jgi:hypothetical protein